MKVVAIPNDESVWASVASWSHAAWSEDFPGDTEQTYLDIYARASINGSSLPYVCVAFDHLNAPIGTATLVEDDELPGFKSFGPWLAAVWVESNHRRKGVANAMVEHIESVARSNGFLELHLYTHDQQAWYARHGWISIGTGKLAVHEVTVMRKQL